MKRFAYLLGNTNGLSGIQKDIADFGGFLESEIGGAWYDHEIRRKKNISLEELRNDIQTIKQSRFDFVVFYFSGHGDHKRSTRLCLNQKEELISEEELEGLAPKQLSIFDCCRKVVSPPKRRTLFSEKEDVWWAAHRAKYNRLLEQATPQHVKMYACQKDQYAHATENGSLYTQCLLGTIADLCKSGNVTATDAHAVCADKVKRMTKDWKYPQEPDSNRIASMAKGTPLVMAIKKLQLLYG